jgi:TFIIF-interacting CTD phosphatase-like protein
MGLFNSALSARSDLVIDRMNFDKFQRERYLKPARDAGYTTRIIVFHVPLKTCLERCNKRTDHPTIKDSASASQAVNLFFSKYERVQDTDADEVMRMGWVNTKAAKCIWSDLDGTLADVEHRRHYVRPTVVATEHRLEDIPTEPVKFKPNWKGFFEEMVLDSVDETCRYILDNASGMYPIVYATGRPDNYKQQTETWLEENNLRYPGSSLFMRARNDMRKDDIVKEIILEFEVKTKYNVFFALDDRDQVVKMLRKHGVKVLQIAEGNF